MIRLEARQPKMADMQQRPSLIIFDVNETLSDLAPLGTAFERAGIEPMLARIWFTEILRDGFALAAAGENVAFAELAADSLHRLLAQTAAGASASEQILQALRTLPLRPDAAAGIPVLAGVAELVTLTNGAPSLAETLLTNGGVRDHFARLLSVQDAPAWKPARSSYEHAIEVCGHPRDRVLLIAAHPWDTHGAKSAGLRAGWINRSGSAYPSYFRRPDLEAPDLVGLSERLQALPA